MKTTTAVVVVVVAVVVVFVAYEFYFKNLSNVSGLPNPSSQLAGNANEYPILKMS